MATIQYYPAIWSDIAIPNNAGRLLDHDDTSAELTTNTGDTVVFGGQGFTYEDDTLSGGTVTEIVYKTYDAVAYRVTDISWDVASEDLPRSVGGNGDLFGGDDTFIGSRVGDYLFAEGGNDRIRAGRGDDFVHGGEGNDVLRGGRGSDTFIFSLGDGIDRIRDFDTSGPTQDVIRILGVEDMSSVTVSQRNQNVVIAFGDDDKIILRHVDLDDLSPKNFDAYRYFDLG